MLMCLLKNSVEVMGCFAKTTHNFNTIFQVFHSFAMIFVCGGTGYVSLHSDIQFWQHIIYQLYVPWHATVQF